MRQKKSDMPACERIVNTAIWVSMQYLASLKRWARRDLSLLLCQDVPHQEGRTHRAAVIFLAVIFLVV